MTYGDPASSITTMNCDRGSICANLRKTDVMFYTVDIF